MSRRATGTGFITGFLVGVLAIPSQAGTSHSLVAFREVPYGPFVREFNDQATIVTNSSYVQAWTVTNHDGGALQPGEMAADARILNGINGAVVATTGWVFTSQTQASHWVIQTAYPAPGIYYSYGRAGYWTGASYATFGTYRSPNQNY